MPINFTCPHCGAQSLVADQYAGQTGPCSKCGQMVTVPGASGVGGDYVPPPRSSSGTSGWTIAAIILGILLAGAVVCGGVFFALLFPAIQGAREAARRVQSSNNLKQIGLGMLHYHDTTKRFPPPYVADDDGKPMHSWRVLLLPFMEHQALYEKYNMDEPWDGPNNSGLASMAMSIYQSPTAENTGSTADYLVVTGPETIFDPDRQTTMADIIDGTSNTIMVVESTGSNIHWMEPRDLKFDELDFSVNGPAGNSIRSGNAQGANVLMADASVRFLNTDVAPEILRAMLTKAGGEMVPSEF